MSPILCNDKHSKLNPTRVASVSRPQTEAEVIATIQQAAHQQLSVSLCGARHAMGGQQFGEGCLLLDLSELNQIGTVDQCAGLVEVGSGVMWPELIDSLHQQQQGQTALWTIRQKQTGADDLSLGGSLSANIHGRGLNMRPIIDDIEAFTLILADGKRMRCSRDQNGELFKLVIGGYGCFGVITSIQLRLTRRQTLKRLVEICTINQVVTKLRQRMTEGCIFGDFQFAIDETSDDFLKLGVLSSYRPVDEMLPAAQKRNELSASDWKKLTRLAHDDRAAAFEMYSAFYLGTHGGLYASDTHQLSIYLEDYHEELDKQSHAEVPGSEVIGELYVPPERLTYFMAEAAKLMKSNGVPVIYGTVRLIRRDEESFLAWAKEDYACIIFNLHTDHDAEGLERTAAAFRALIDLALAEGGSFYLTYHRWARRDQIERAYPQFERFLELKDHYDPDSLFQSEWWRHYRAEFGS